MRFAVAFLVELVVVPAVIVLLIALYAVGLPGLEIVIVGVLFGIAYAVVRTAMSLHGNSERKA